MRLKDSPAIRPKPTFAFAGSAADEAQERDQQTVPTSETLRMPPSSLYSIDSLFRLDGTHALVTGAGRGIGRAVTLGLAAAGAHVHALARTQADLDSVVSQVQESGGCATAIAGDVTNAADIRRVFAALPSLDILINNAGANIPEPFTEVSKEHLDRLLDINVRATFLVAQAAARLMLARQRKGSIINMSSQMGHVGAAGRTVYCMAKHAIEGLTKAMAVELARHSIRVNSVAPTFIETPMTEPFLRNQSFREWVLSRIPLGRLGCEQDVVGAVIFLASPAAGLVTVTSIVVDGGWTAQ